MDTGCFSRQKGISPGSWLLRFTWHPAEQLRLFFMHWALKQAFLWTEEKESQSKCLKATGLQTVFPSLQNTLYSGGDSCVCLSYPPGLAFLTSQSSGPFVPMCAGLGEGPCSTRWITCDVLWRHMVCKLGDLLFLFIKWPNLAPVAWI